MALWLDFEQLSSYLFISRCLFRAAISKCYMEFDTKLEDWINRYLIQTYQRLSQEYFKSYRIAFRVALWLDFEQSSGYLSVYRRLFRVTLSKYYMEFDTNWMIESTDILLKFTTGYLKSISSHIELLLGALWLGFEQLSSYLFISRCLFRAAISKCYMEFDTKLEDWINRYLIQTYHRLSQEYFKSYRIAFRVALWLDFEQLSSYLFVYRRFSRVTLSKCYMEFDANWRIESRDILFKLTTGYLKSISSHIE